jgi:FtsP/CotA-like multicopper oxidase with cupredoxin domain
MRALNPIRPHQFGSRPWLAWTLGAFLVSWTAGAAVPPEPPPAAPPAAIQPTVTPQMGDLGGTFNGRAPDPSRTHRYFIAAEPELWDYTPEGRDPLGHMPPSPGVAAQHQASKFRYVQYTDQTFQTRLIQPPRLGILGPVLRGVVGDYLVITFLNRCNRPLSMHPHGAKYDKDSEGAYYGPRHGLGAAVGPGAMYTYVWFLDEASGPRPDEPSSKAWLYHSHVVADEEINLGLVGFLIVTDPRRARPDGSPRDVDREQAALFMIFDESGLGAAEKEAAEYAHLPGAPPPKTWAEIQQLLEAGQRYSINGYVFGNLPGLEMNQGERVRWYLLGLGSEGDIHTAHWHGLRVLEEGRRRTDVVELLPATMTVADMTADNPGTWLFHCHVAEHMMEGMFAPMVVHPKDAGDTTRAPAPAFFGLPQDQRSALIRKATAHLDTTGGCRIELEGSVTVFEAFSAFTAPVTVRLLGRSVQFKPDTKGLARTGDGELRIVNASPQGVVYGGLMDLAITLRGPQWCEALARHGLAAGRSGKRLSVPVTIQVGDASHKATMALMSGVE